MFRIAALVGLLAGPAAAATYSCEGWSGVNQIPPTTVLVSVSEPQMTLSEGEEMIEAQRIDSVVDLFVGYRFIYLVNGEGDENMRIRRFPLTRGTQGAQLSCSQQ